MRIVLLIVFFVLFFVGCQKDKREVVVHEDISMFQFFEGSFISEISQREERKMSLEERGELESRKYSIFNATDSLEYDLLNALTIVSSHVVYTNYFSLESIYAIKDILSEIRKARIPFQKYASLLRVEAFIQSNFTNRFKLKREKLLVLLSLMNDYFFKVKKGDFYWGSNGEYNPIMVLIRNNPEFVYLDLSLYGRLPMDLKLQLFNNEGQEISSKMYNNIDSVAIPLKEENLLAKITYEDEKGYVEYIKIGKVSDTILLKIMKEVPVLNIEEWMKEEYGNLFERLFGKEYDRRPVVWYTRLFRLKEKIQFNPKIKYSIKNLQDIFQLFYSTYYEGGRYENSNIFIDSNSVHKDDQVFIRAYKKSINSIDKMNNYFYFVWLRRITLHFEYKTSFCGVIPENLQFSMLKTTESLNDLIIFTGSIIQIGDKSNVISFPNLGWKKQYDSISFPLNLKLKKADGSLINIDPIYKSDLFYYSTNY